MNNESKIIISAATKLLANLSKYDTHELIEDMLNYCDKIGIQDITEEDVLEYLKVKLNIL